MKKTLMILALVGSSLVANAMKHCTDWVTVPGTNNNLETRTCQEEKPHPAFPWLTTTVYTTEYALTVNIPVE